MPDAEPSNLWIDDNLKTQLKQTADFISLLYSFGASEIKSTSNPNQFKAKCIFPDCKPKKNDYPLGINTEKNIFNCFHCGRKGDILDLIMKIKNISFYEAKKFLLNWNKGLVKDTLKSQPKAVSIPITKKEEANIKIVYKPFRRKLTGLRIKDIPDLENKGINSKTAEKFNVGYCSQGMMKGRIVVPIYDSRISGTYDKNILIYAGYSVTKKQKNYGDWKFPDGFEKGKELFNLNRITADTKHAKETLQRHGLIVVESFWNVLKLYQAGITNVVALMGTALTDEQEKLLLDSTDKVKLWLDTDEAGQKALKSIINVPKHNGNNGLIYKTHLKIINPETKLSSEKLGDKVKPYQFTEEEIKEILS